MSLDFERARFNMIEQQVRPWEVLDPRVLETMTRVRREDFVPVRWRKLAFSDVALPLDGGDEVMMKPVVEGRMLQALEVQPGDAVLEVGTGSGYITACLAALGRDVDSIDIRAEFVERARQRLAAIDVTNVRLATADALAGLPAGREYDCICVTGAVFTIQDSWRRALKPGGRLFAVRGRAPAMEAVLLTRIGAAQWTETSLFETDLPYLVNAAPPREFVL
jgi:protein-L-isoaspartate(D-aspartate) O-methyltransferase